MILDDEIRALLVNKVPSGCSLWITSDSCHSGTVADLRYTFTDACFRSLKASADKDMPAAWTPEPREIVDSEASTRLGARVVRFKELKSTYDPSSVTASYLYTEDKSQSTTAGNVVLLSGCMDQQFSADAGFDSIPQGALTWAMLQVLRKNGLAVPLKYLMKDIRGLLLAGGFDQKPQLSSGKKISVDSPFNLVWK